MKKLTFPYKIGDTVRIVSLHKWNDSLCKRKPGYRLIGKDMIITKIGNYEFCSDVAAIADGAPEDAIIEYFPFAAICINNGKEYGLVYVDENEFIHTTKNK